MEKEPAINKAGTPQHDHVYAVFDHMEQAHHAIQALSTQGIQAHHLNGGDAAHLLREAVDPLGKAERLVKRIGGETHEAERYAWHLEQGRIVLAVRVEHKEAADAATQTLKQHGAYDVTYFRGWAIQYMSPLENTQHGLPTHSLGNRNE
jgi:hypothetical protein